MNKSKWISALVVTAISVSAGVTAMARPPVASPHAGDAMAHRTGHESRTVADCEHLPGNANEAGNPPASNMRYWCMRCIVGHEGRQHFHPDCPVGARCAPDNGAAQCGGGAF